MQEDHRPLSFSDRHFPYPSQPSPLPASPRTSNVPPSPDVGGLHSCTPYLAPRQLPWQSPIQLDQLARQRVPYCTEPTVVLAVPGGHCGPLFAVHILAVPLAVLHHPSPHAVPVRAGSGDPI